MDGYITTWARDWIREILNNGDEGPLSVIYAGPHQSLPALGKVGVGDTIYPATLIAGQLHVLARMTVAEILDAEEGAARFGLTRRGPWDWYAGEHKAMVTHKVRAPAPTMPRSVLTERRSSCARCLPPSSP